MTGGRCRHCGATHDPRALVCPTTGHRIAEPRRPTPAPIPAVPAPRPAVLAGASTAKGSLLGRVIGDRYGVTGLIGEGGMGVVYEAEHLALGKLVALKVLHPRHAQDKEAVSRLRHEARVAGTLGHPNICAIYDTGRLDDGSPYLVLERLHGETLAQRLARVGRLEVADMVDLMLQVLSALAAAHQRGVVHRDLKPDNVFLSVREGVRPIPKLLDFGISKAEEIEDTMADLPTSQAAAGTPYYMAPEQARGDRNSDARVDLWSAGVVLYEGLTGQRPFQARNFNALLREILEGPHRPLRELDPSLPAGLGLVVDKALAKRPDARYLSALEFQNALRSYKDLEDEPPRKVIPILVNEQTSDEPDGTHVFSRIDLNADRGSDEEATPIFYGRDGVSPIEDERTTQVDPPRFADEDPTTLRRPFPGRKL